MFSPLPALHFQEPKTFVDGLDGMNTHTKIHSLIMEDPVRLSALRLVHDLGLPDCWIAAGFVRNMVWDFLHGFGPSPLNDIDVIYFDPRDLDSQSGMAAESHLSNAAPHQNWQVRNQAVMHIRNGHPPYASSSDAMSHWPEIETAVAVRLLQNGTVELCAPFGVRSLLLGFITMNARSSSKIFRKRIREKRWLTKWPLLKVVTQQGGEPNRARSRRVRLIRKTVIIP